MARADGARQVVAAPAECGVYAITHKATGARYIGSSATMKARWVAHRSELRRSRHSSRKLQALWDRDGEAAFVFEVIEPIEDARLLADREWQHQDNLEATSPDLLLNTSRYTTTRRGNWSVKGAKTAARKAGRQIPPHTKPRLWYLLFLAGLEAGDLYCITKRSIPSGTIRGIIRGIHIPSLEERADIARSFGLQPEQITWPTENNIDRYLCAAQRRESVHVADFMNATNAFLGAAQEYRQAIESYFSQEPWAGLDKTGQQYILDHEPIAQKLDVLASACQRIARAAADSLQVPQEAQE